MPFMRYVEARRKSEKEEKIYRIYITDSLKAAYGLSARYYDLIDDTPVEERDPNEVINNIKAHLENLSAMEE